MHTTFRLSVFLLFIVQLFCSCTSDSLPEPDSTQPETPAGIPDAYQDKIRTQPYPKADNELYLNPAPLIVPQAMKTGAMPLFRHGCAEGRSAWSAPRCAGGRNWAAVHAWR